MLGYWTAVVIAIASIVLTLVQLRRSRFQQSVDLLFRMENTFFKREQEQRAKAAQGIQSGDFTEAEPILDQFETIALLVSRHALDRYMVWHTFYYWMNNYYELCAGYIRDRQKDDPIYWQDLTKLVPKLRAFDAKQRGVSLEENKLSKSDLESFLQEELQETSGRHLLSD